LGNLTGVWVGLLLRSQLTWQKDQENELLRLSLEPAELSTQISLKKPWEFEILRLGGNVKQETRRGFGDIGLGSIGRLFNRIATRGKLRTDRKSQVNGNPKISEHAPKCFGSNRSPPKIKAHYLPQKGPL
jgi:hypothetical protein